MKTQVFAYKGYVGILAGDKFVNDPTQPGQLGCVVDLAEVVISKEAFELLRKVKKSNDDIGDVMCFGKTFAWLGGAKKLMDPRVAEGDNKWEPQLLEHNVAEVEIPKDFIEAVDKAVV